MTNDPIARYLSRRTSFGDRRTILRMMRTGEIFDLALRCYQRLGWTYLRLTLVPALLCLSAYLFDWNIALPSLFVTNHAGNLNAQVGEAVVAVALALFVAGPLFLVGVSWSTCVVAQLVSDTLLGNVPSPSAALAAARRALPRVIGVNLVQLLGPFLGFLISGGLLVGSAFVSQATSQTDASAGGVAVLGVLGMIVAGLMFLLAVCKFALAPSVAILEGSGVRASARRGAMLQKPLGYHTGGGGTVFGLFCLSALVYFVIEIGIGSTFQIAGVNHFLTNFFSNIPYGAIFLAALKLLPSFLAIWTIIPFWAATLTILYYERRVRLEGYDIEALAADVWRTDLQARFEL